MELLDSQSLSQQDIEISLKRDSDNVGPGPNLYIMEILSMKENHSLIFCELHH